LPHIFSSEGLTMPELCRRPTNSFNAI